MTLLQSWEIIPDIDLVQFYVNAINTRTRGIDAVLNGRWKINKTRLGLTMAASFNRNSIFGKSKLQLLFLILPAILIHCLA